MDLNRWVYIGVRGAILAQNIYCANHNPDPGAHSGSRVRRGLGDWYPRSTLEYDLTTKIVIRTLTQPMTCKMGSSIFAAMGQLKVTSTTSAFFPTITSTKKTNGENISVGCIKPSRVCPSWFFSTDTKNYPFPLASKYSCQCLQTWRQWPLPYGFPIGPGLTRHPVFLGWSLCDTPPP